MSKRLQAAESVNGLNKSYLYIIICFYGFEEEHEMIELHV